MLGRILKTLLLLLLTALVVILVLAIDGAPRVSRVSSAQVANADTVNSLLTQLKGSLADRHAQQRVVITEKQFESLMGFAQRALPGFSGSVAVEQSQTDLAASIALPTPFNSLYFNFSARVIPGKGVDIEHVQVGDLRVPGDMALAVSVWLVDVLTSSDVASTAANQITQITMTDERLVLEMRPLDELLQQLDVARENMATGESELGKLTSEYLAFVNASDLGQSASLQSVASYLTLLLKRAAELSDDESRVAHNQAALLSLAIFIGDHRIARLTGATLPNNSTSIASKAPAVLAQRNDLARHFSISAALQILSQQDMTLAIGEFKELMDRARGGSGYSFVDLAADMSGIALARVATDPEGAARLQLAASQTLRERDILPAINDLPEGLGKAEFARRFGEVDSPEYRQQVGNIQDRIDRLPLYR